MGHQPGSVAVIHRVWTLWKNEALLKGHNLLYIIAALLALMFASTTFFFWYHEMFRDGFIGEFSRAFDSGGGEELRRPHTASIRSTEHMLVHYIHFGSNYIRPLAPDCPHE